MDLVSVQQFLMMKVQVLKFRYAHLNVCQGAEITRYFFFGALLWEKYDNKRGSYRNIIWILFFVLEWFLFCKFCNQKRKTKIPRNKITI